MQADAGGTVRPAPKPREQPDPDERGRAYEAMRAHVSPETPEEASPGRGPDAGDRGSSRDDVPRSYDTWADHDRRWQERTHAVVDRSDHRPELPAATDEAVGQVLEAGRTLSADPQAIDQENKRGSWPEGAELRRNDEDRREGKIATEPAEETSRGQPPDAADQRSYWDEVPRFLEMNADLEKRWPTDQRPAPDRPDDPPGSYRSDGGFYLNPERHADTIIAIGRIREAEPGISANVCAVEQQNGHAGWLEGFERRLKAEDRLKEKVAERCEGEPDKTPGEIVREVADAIRYTLCIRSDSYPKGYYDIKERLESHGYEMYESRNSWSGAEYKGINTRWVTQEGQRFEVQFHTPESFHAKQYVTHKAYERIRNPLTSDEERAELKVFQREVCAHVPLPNGAQDIPDFKKRGF
jgi:hypothetical protein